MWAWLSKLFAAPPPVAPQRVWLTSAARDRAVCEEARLAAEGGAAVVVMASFRDQLNATAAAFHATEIEVELWRPPATLPQLREALRSERGRILLTQTAMLPLAETERADEASGIPAGTSRETVLIAAELPPLPREDARLLELARLLPASSFCIHVSLDDALLALFGGDSVRELLKTMGMNEDEAIESPMVSRRITTAEKFAQRVIDDQPADSAEEWMQRNLRPVT